MSGPDEFAVRKVEAFIPVTVEMLRDAGCWVEGDPDPSPFPWLVLFPRLDEAWLRLRSVWGEFRFRVGHARGALAGVRCEEDCW